ncbi:MAG: hypothetical protein H7Z13_02895 [Ferruginibacter sp.]|nr:hypothetical protein [Ferruginibacter sp.]
MKTFLSVLLLLLSACASSQTVNISGRCYYDVNGNQVFDGGDSVLADRYVQANYSNTYIAGTDDLGQYEMVVPVGSYSFVMGGEVDNLSYYTISSLNKVYTSAGNYVLDFAYQKKDSIVNVFTYNSGNHADIPFTGGTRQYTLIYGYEGRLKSTPATLSVNFNPMVSFVNASIPPSVSGSGKLQWNLPNVQHSRNEYNPRDAIVLTFNYPAFGDTIGSFIFAKNFVPGIKVASNYVYKSYPLEQYVEFPVSQAKGSTSGVKWLRHFAGRPNTYEICVSVDTIQNGDGYFITGEKAHQADSVFSGMDIPFISKLNKDGLSVWEKYLHHLPGINFFSAVSAIRHTTDGGCMVLGNAYGDSTNNYSRRVLVARFDLFGNYIWGKAINGAKYNNLSEDMLILPDGSCLITGSTYSHNADFLHNNADTVFSNVFVAKISSAGNVIFTKIYGGNRNDYGHRLVSLQNGSFLVLATTSSASGGDVVGSHQPGVYDELTHDTSYKSDAWVLNIDGNGNIIWSKCYGGNGDSYITGAVNNNAGILLTGSTNAKNGDLPYYPESAVTLWVLQISNSGIVINSKLHKLYKGYQDSNYVKKPLDVFYDNRLSSRLHKMKDGNFILGGSITDKYGTIKGKHGGVDLTIVKINPSGDIIWQKAIGGTSNEYLMDIQLDNNNDIIFVGNSSSLNDDLYQDVGNYGALMVVGKLGITNVIKGLVFIDNNGNHIKDAGEHFYSQGRINSIKSRDTTSARIFDGRFLNNVDTGNYISTYKPVNNYYTVYPAAHNTSFTSFDLKDSVDFALTPKPNVNDLEIQLSPLSTPRPGFDATYRIITKNVGTTTINNVIVGLKKDTRQTYLSASRPKSGMLADSIWWGPFTLNAYDIDTLYATVTLAAPPTLNNGDTVSLRVTANPVVNDSSVNNNIFNIREIVRGSFDPNDKTEIHAGTLTTTQYAGGEYLQYMIRFQNTGTDTAFFITVKDTLRAGLNVNSLDMVSASHPYTFSLEGNIATWDFKKILLPDSATNQAGSNGFILFKIKPSAGLAVGDEFTNKAAIYFDYNLPVITNEDKTVIGANKGICPTGNAIFTAGITGAGYQWQVNNGAGFTDLTNADIYSGANTSVLVITSPPTSMHGYRYRCVVNDTINSPENKLKFSVYWKGTTNNAWENTANWDCGVLPDAQTEVIIPSGHTYPLVSNNASCYSLRLSPDSMVTVKTGFKLNIVGKLN